MEAVYPAAGSALTRGRRLRLRRAADRARYHTQPVTFAEIKEVDEDCEGSCEAGGSGDVTTTERRRRVDVLAAPRRRRATHHVISEPPEESPVQADESVDTSPRHPSLSDTSLRHPPKTHCAD